MAFMPANFLPSINLMCKQKIVEWWNSCARLLACVNTLILFAFAIDSDTMMMIMMTTTIVTGFIVFHIILLLKLIVLFPLLLLHVHCTFFWLLLSILSSVQFSLRNICTLFLNLCSNHFFKLFAEQILAVKWCFLRLFIAPDNLKVK